MKRCFRRPKLQPWKNSRGMALPGFPLNQPFSFNFSVPPPSTGICADCASLDLETAFARAHTLYERARRGLNTRSLVSCRSQNGPVYLRDFYFVASLGRRLSENRSCKLCSFLKQHADDPSKGTYKVLAICSSESSLFEPPKRDSRGKWTKRYWDDLEHNVFLAVVPEVSGIPRTAVPLRWLELDLPRKGSIYRLTQESRDEEGKRLILPGDLGPSPDFSLVKYWMATCSMSHGLCCALEKPPGATLRGFRAINCTKNPPDVQDIPWSEKYVALSYVWGANAQKWPQSIRDAVIVTRRLGYKYLWVDRLCIDQSNPNERKYLISRMGAIYEHAEFVLINAAGDAQTGLPGVGKTLRRSQLRVELDLPKGEFVDRLSDGDAYLDLLNVAEAEYDNETAGHTMWLDTYRHGLKNMMQLSLDGPTLDEERMQRYGIPRDQLDFHQDSATHFRIPFDEYMDKQQELAGRMGLKLHELIPHLLKEAARKAGVPDDQPTPTLAPPDESIVTDPNQAEIPLPPGKVPGKVVLVSTMEEPRVTIRASQWATRGWTYQESILSRRCLVFTPEQVYWECRGMAVNESMLLPLPKLHVRSEPGQSWRFADYMLSGIFRGEMHRAPELDYGFKQEDTKDNDVAAQITALDRHIRSFTSRKLTDPTDSWNAFLGIAAQYIGNDQGLSLFLGIPFWAGSFGDGQPAVQHTFAMSMSLWCHVGQPIEPRSSLFVADCPRRSKFPSWSWVGWEGSVDFNGDDVAQTEINSANDNDAHGHNAHIDFFFTMTSPEWAKSIDRVWSANLMLHSEDGNNWTLLQGNLPLHNFENSNKRWLLTIKQPLVLKHMYLMRCRNKEEWRRLMDKLVEVHLSVPLTEQELMAAHRSGDLVVVLLFASIVPFIWDGRARFLVLRRTEANGEHWERIGRLDLTMEEWVMAKYTSTQSMIDDLPVHEFEGDLTLV